MACYLRLKINRGEYNLLTVSLPRSEFKTNSRGPDLLCAFKLFCDETTNRNCVCLPLS